MKKKKVIDKMEDEIEKHGDPNLRQTILTIIVFFLCLSLLYLIC